MRNEPLKDLNALIPALEIKARLGMSSKELRLIYEKRQKDFEKEVNSERFKNVLTLKKARKRKRDSSSLGSI